MSVISDTVRKQFKAGDDIRDAGLTTPDNIERFDDIAYGLDHTWQMLDVYRPRTVDGKPVQLPLPVIVSVHGGGWVYGDKDRYQWYCMNLAQHGFVVVNFSYRLAPEYKFPASVEDTCAAFSWTLANIAQYGGDTEHIFAVGDSAGAHMLSLFCNMCINPSYAAEYDFAPPAGFVPTAIALNCGAYEIHITSDPTDLTSTLMGDYLPEGGSARELNLVNVAPHVTAQFPPAFIMTCDDDFLHDMAQPFSQLLRDLKVCHELHVYGGIEKPLPHVFHCNMRSDDAARCNDDECRFFKRFL
ncbi:MAG: alpha/beta hydrolase [Coriobacteriales bacterium]|nr:alpha/beta hydrolase [Coriobacteriales bacterium]